MSYNHGKEERKWQRWKLAEEKVLRACGMDESTIEQLRLWDRAMFNSDRRFYEKLQDTGTYLDSVAESEAPTEIYTAEDLLNDIDNAELLKALLTVDKLTLQISVLKMNGYSTNEIAVLVHLSTDAIYKRIPFWASIGLSVTPLPLGSGVQYESRVSLGYLNQSFQNAVRDGIRYGLEQGLFGWNVTDCKICFEYGLYYSPVSTPADFRSLAPIVLEQALKESGTQLLEPYLSFTLYAPREYLSRAYHDAPKYCATIETVQVKKDEVVFTGEIPARCIQAYRTDLAFYTNGQSVCLTELKGYQAAVGKPVIQPRRPNSRLDKVRYMFQKIM